MARGTNILFITSDQPRADRDGFEGRRVKSPHLDAISRRPDDAREPLPQEGMA